MMEPIEDIVFCTNYLRPKDKGALRPRKGFMANVHGAEARTGSDEQPLIPGLLVSMVKGETCMADSLLSQNLFQTAYYFCSSSSLNRA